MKRQIIDAHYHNCQWFSHGQTFLEFQQEYREKCGVAGLLLLCVPSIKGQATHFCPAQNILGAISKLEDKTNTTYIYGGLFYPDAPVIPEKAEEYNFKAQAERLMEIGFDGMKMLESKPTMHKALSYSVDSAGYEEFFSYLEKNKIPLNSHVNDPHSFWDKDKMPPAFFEKGWFYGDGTYASKEQIYFEIYNVLERHPGIRITLPHGFFMGHCLDELTKVMEKYKNVSIDLAPGPSFFQSSVGHYDEFKSFFNKYYKRILFGTDANNLSEFSLTQKLAEDVYRFFATEDEYVAFEYYGSTCNLKGLGLSGEKVDCIVRKNFINMAGETPKKIDKALFKKYVENFLPYMEEDETKKEIIRYCKEKL